MVEELDTYFKTLCMGVNPTNIQVGFVHHESDGIKALDQSGTKGKKMQSRLYIFPQENEKILHIISIGTKVDQKGDISECRDYVKPLKKEKDG